MNTIALNPAVVWVRNRLLASLVREEAVPQTNDPLKIIGFWIPGVWNGTQTLSSGS